MANCVHSLQKLYMDSEANGLDPEAMDKIYAAKGRPSDNPLILHVPNSESIKPLVTEVSNTAQLLMDTFGQGH